MNALDGLCPYCQGVPDHPDIEGCAGCWGCDFTGTREGSEKMEQLIKEALEEENEDY